MATWNPPISVDHIKTFGVYLKNDLFVFIFGTLKLIDNSQDSKT